MDNETRIELGGGVLVVVFAALFGLLYAAADIGLWAWIFLGLALVVLGAVAVYEYARRHRHPGAADAPRPAAAQVPHQSGAAGQPGETLRVLVVADTDCVPRDLQEALAERVRARKTEVLVVAPALSSRLARWTGDDSAYADAQAHLERTLAALGELGVEAHGHIGPHDPLQAADDGLREFEADELIFTTGPNGEDNWLEEGLLETARGRYGIPVTEVRAHPS
jgi:hypothetical protein